MEMEASGAAGGVELGDWALQARCRGMDPAVFFPDHRRGTHSRAVPEEVQHACGMCPVRDECREHAIAYEKHGIWAGMTERMRRTERASRARVARAMERAEAS